MHNEDLRAMSEDEQMEWINENTAEVRRLN